VEQSRLTVHVFSILLPLLLLLLLQLLQSLQNDIKQTSVWDNDSSRCGCQDFKIVDISTTVSSSKYLGHLCKQFFLEQSDLVPLPLKIHPRKCILWCLGIGILTISTWHASSYFHKSSTFDYRREKHLLTSCTFLIKLSWDFIWNIKVILAGHPFLTSCNSEMSAEIKPRLLK